jgi:PPOX class probable F420-dependent enzyme
VTPDEAIAKLGEARVGRLATVRPDGSPHVVPFVFAIVRDRDDLLAFWAVDDKRKEHRAVQRLANIQAHPAVEFVVDGYDDDWSQLWWVRVKGRARVVSSPSERTRAIAALSAKYPQYEANAPTDTVIAIEVDRVTEWSAT